MKKQTLPREPFKLFFLIQKGSEFRVESVVLTPDGNNGSNASYTIPKGWKFVKVID